MNVNSFALIRVHSRFLGLFVFAAAFACAAEPVTLRVGAAHEDITPDTAVLNWVTGKPYGAILDRLNVHALVLDDGANKAVVIRWDLTDVGESARDTVRRAVGSAVGAREDFILINASHNHSAPWTPVYGDNHRGSERDTWWAIRYMPAQNEFPPFHAWMERLVAATVKAAQRAAESARTASVSISRIAVSEYLYNRRPRAAGWGVDRKSAPAPGASSPEWNPEILYGGASFGPLDRTMSLVLFRDADAKPIATLFHLACHAVSIYPSNPAISGDWPGAATRQFDALLGGENLFLQGCAGDINPWRRGAEAVAQMGEGLAKKAQLATRYAAKLTLAPLLAARTTVTLPLTPEAKKRLNADTVAAEIQVLTCGPLAFVTLPGEPMTELGAAIREKSPFPQTLVLGYSNGNGVHYVGMPGEKARGGYEAGVAGAGTDECGALLVAAANDLLREVYAKMPGIAKAGR
jgi:hypothetical protein